MNSSTWLQRLALWPTTLATAYVVGACAAGPEIVDHSFQFDAIRDSPGITVLDYRYGDSKTPGTRGDESYIRAGNPLQSINVNGAMRRGDALWVKWKVLAENKIYEDTVDLKTRLPGNISEHILYFRVEGAQLYVYLVSPERRKNDEPAVGPRKYRHLSVALVYPDQAKK